MAHADHSTSTATAHAAGVLPDPGDVADFGGRSNKADELMARLADQQIDELLDDADAAPRDEQADAALELALQAASELKEVAEPLRDAAAQAMTQDLAAGPAVDATHPVVSMQPAVESPAEAAADPAPAEAAELLVPPATAAELGASAAAEPELIESPTEPSPAAPSFDPPRPATIDAEPTDELKTAGEALALGEPPAEPSSADAVARELEADVALLSAPLPSPEHLDDSEVHVATWPHRVKGFVLDLPMTILSLINLPVQPLSDRGREILGASAILTLVNAVGLLAYLRFFAHRH